MNTTQLECFVSLARTLNYKQTAEELNFTQPAISKQIQALEKEMNVTLFIRTTRSVRLSTAGENFYPEARNLIELFKKARASVSSALGCDEELRIGFLDSSLPTRLAPCISALIEKHPNLKPLFCKEETDINLKALKERQLDVVIGIKDQKFQDENIVFEKIRDDYFVCLLNVKHPLAKKFHNKEIHSADLWPYRQIISIPGYMLKGSFSRGRNLIPVNDELSNIFCRDSSEVYGLVKANYGFALIPEHQCQEYKDVVSIRWAESEHADFGIYHRKDNSQVTRELIGKMKKEF